MLNSPISQPDRYSHPLPSIVLEDYFLTTGEEQNLLMGDLMGTRLTSPELKRIHRNCRGETFPKFETNFRNTQHGSAYFGIMADAIALCGYRGWVLLLNEVELVGRFGQSGATASLPQPQLAIKLVNSLYSARRSRAILPKSLSHLHLWRSGIQPSQ